MIMKNEKITQFIEMFLQTLLFLIFMAIALCPIFIAGFFDNALYFLLLFISIPFGVAGLHILMYKW